MSTYHRHSVEIEFAVKESSEADALQKISEVVLPLLRAGAERHRIRLVAPTRQDRRLQGYFSDRTAPSHFTGLLVFDSPEESGREAVQWIGTTLDDLSSKDITLGEIRCRTFGGG